MHPEKLPNGQDDDHERVNISSGRMAPEWLPDRFSSAIVRFQQRFN
jgi:hypothetical protein